MAYAWIIDKDVSSFHGDDASTIGPHRRFYRHPACTIGPHRADPKLVEQLMTDKRAGDTFRMLDDDGELYYVGRIILDDNTSGFEPLDDFGMPNAGCTSIEYREKNGAWVML